MSDIFLHKKPAVKIKAKLLRTWDHSNLYDCEGDKKWIPDKVCKYDDNEKTIIISQWWYDKEFGDSL